MNIVKELKDIAWNVPESVYREDPALSYSTLSTYESLGFNGLDRLFDKKESLSLTLGSAVDAIITGGADEFNSRFIVRDIKITDSGIATCKILASMPQPYATFNEIPERIVSQAAKEAEFWKGDKWDNVRYKKILETGDVADYYNSLINSDKTLLTTANYDDVIAMVKALRESASTCGYFAEDDELSPIRRYYQLKFKAKVDGVAYRNMADLLIVDYEKKKVYPIDLKTSLGCTEWDFQDNFKKWHYYIQARLYWRLIRITMDNDPYFKDFSLEDYRFIIVNPKTLTPLVWEFPLTKEYGTLVDDEGNEIRDPYEIGKELRGYLNLRPAVPNGINKDGINIITCLKKKD